MGYFLALAWGSYRLSTGMITFGTMTVFLQLIGQIQGPFLGLARSLSRIISTLASASRLIELDKLPTEKEVIDDNGEVNIKNDYCVEIKDLKFGYKKDTLVLEKVSLKVLPGEIVAIRGPSGEGKTTLVKLLLAFALPDNGTVLLEDSFGVQQCISTSTRTIFFVCTSRGTQYFLEQLRRI